MFYCDPCAEPRNWPTGTLRASRGPCEICYTVTLCNEVPSKYLSIPPASVRDAKPEERP